MDCSISEPARGFHKHTRLAIMPILASEALLRENKKKSSDKMLPPVSIEPLAQDSKSCNTWYFDFGSFS